MRKATSFMILVLRLVLQIIGTYFVGKYVIEKIASIPASTWGWMALIVLIVVLLIAVWLYTVVEVFKRDEKGPKQ